MANWNPFEEMETLRREVDRAFEEFGFGSHAPRRIAFLPGESPRRYPLINLLEDKDHLYIEALMPGVDTDTLNLTVIQDRLTLSGEKSRIPEAVRPESFHRNERASGKFVRTIELPVEVNESGVTAEYKNGLLVVRLSKAEKVKPRQVSVKVV